MAWQGIERINPDEEVSRMCVTWESDVGLADTTIIDLLNEGYERLKKHLENGAFQLWEVRILSKNIELSKKGETSELTSD